MAAAADQTGAPQASGAPGAPPEPADAPEESEAQAQAVDHGPRRVFLGLGSNLGDRVRYLRDAVATLREIGHVALSPVYETDPVGPPDQDRYLNLVAELRSDRTPHELLGVCHRLETAAGRVRKERWGPRTLDVDVLWIEGETVDEPDLVVPHPRMWERRFVVAPLHDLAPDLVDDAAVDAADGAVDWRGPLDNL